MGEHSLELGGMGSLGPGERDETGSAASLHATPATQTSTRALCGIPTILPEHFLPPKAMDQACNRHQPTKLTQPCETIIGPILPMRKLRHGVF